MGVTNPGYRPDDKGATAFPASIVVGSSFNPRRTLPDYRSTFLTAGSTQCSTLAAHL